MEQRFQQFQFYDVSFSNLVMCKNNGGKPPPHSCFQLQMGGAMLALKARSKVKKKKNVFFN